MPKRDYSAVMGKTTNTNNKSNKSTKTNNNSNKNNSRKSEKSRKTSTTPEPPYSPSLTPNLSQFDTIEDNDDVIHFDTNISPSGSPESIVVVDSPISHNKDDHPYEYIRTPGYEQASTPPLFYPGMSEPSTPTYYEPQQVFQQQQPSICPIVINTPYILPKSLEEKIMKTDSKTEEELKEVKVESQEFILGKSSKKTIKSKINDFHDQISKFERDYIEALTKNNTVLEISLKNVDVSREDLKELNLKELVQLRKKLTTVIETLDEEFLERVTEE